MGLESIVNDILQDKAPDIRALYGWNDGLQPEDDKDGPKIAAAINKYGKGRIGHAHWNPKSGRVEFGAFEEGKGRKRWEFRN